LADPEVREDIALWASVIDSLEYDRLRTAAILSRLAFTAPGELYAEPSTSSDDVMSKAEELFD